MATAGARADYSLWRIERFFLIGDIVFRLMANGQIVNAARWGDGSRTYDFSNHTWELDGLTIIIKDNKALWWKIPLTSDDHLPGTIQGTDFSEVAVTGETKPIELESRIPQA